ncbi:hypothetical protein LSH36_17g04005 [Paralvinella palmiformis]|uniref:Uncharacterized protein n=1 Tax=Paralvinella palmiformis TaxID=53620 RepID=A0AAD9KCW5_9ANNE|nr:hypothetical protein LSH36_17g04005 [Paralvinella palmiformis]
MGLSEGCFIFDFATITFGDTLTLRSYRTTGLQIRRPVIIADCETGTIWISTSVPDVLIHYDGTPLCYGVARKREHVICALRGELTVYCDGPENKAYCELKDHENGTFTLTVRPQDVGFHKLHVLYNDDGVVGSPFILRVSSASLIDVKGVGITSGVLKRGNTYEIQIDSRQAGPGSLKIRIGGPRISGAFRVQTKKENKLLRCRYNPQLPGLYIVNVLWSGDHVPGSPYNVYLARTSAELNEYLNKIAKF